MDILALQQAMKAKKAMTNLRNRLGANVQGTYPSVDARLTALENQRVLLTDKTFVFDTDTDWNSGTKSNTVSTNGVLSLTSGATSGTWTSPQLTLDSDAIQFANIELVGATNPDGITVSTNTGAGWVPVDSNMNIKSVFSNTIQVRVQLQNGASLDKLVVHYKAKPIWNRVSDLEAATAINLNKTNMFAKSVINKNRYDHTEMAVDNLGDSSGIDASKSSNYVFDATNKKIAVASGQTSATIVTTTETTVTPPTEMQLSVAMKPIDTASKSVNLAGGKNTNTSNSSGQITLAITSSSGANPTTYAPSGTWESDVIDLGDNFKSFVNLIDVISLPTGATNIVPVMTSNNTPSPYVASASSTYSIYLPWYAFNGNPNDFWISNTLPAQLMFDFGAPQVISAYAITIRANTQSQNPKSWTFEGSNDGVTWTVLDTQSNVVFAQPQETRTFPFQNSKSYRYYRLNISQAYLSGSYCAIAELKMMPPAGSITISTATSMDNVTFSPYQPLNPDGTIASPPGRYLKVRVDMTGGYQVVSNLKNDFVASEASQFQSDPQITFDGSLHEVISYSTPMTVDSSWTDTGTLLRSTIDLSQFKTIEKVQVSRP